MSSHNNPNASAIPAATLLEAIKRSLADPEKNFIAEGAEAKIYRLEGFDNLVIRVTTEDAIQGTAHIFQAEDLYEGRNLGQEIFKGQGFTINYKQSGVSPRKTIAGFIDHHVAAGTAHPQIQGVTDFWEKMANLPAASYENFLHDMNAATKAGRIIDPLNCNYLIDDQQHPPKIGWVDVAAKEGRNSPNSLEGAKGAIFSATAQVEFTNRQQEFEFGSAKYDGNPEALALQQRMDAALAKIDAKLRSAAEVTHTPLLSNDVPAYEERIGAKQLELYPAGAKTLPAHIDLQSFF